MSRVYPDIPLTRPESKDDMVCFYGPFVGHWAKRYLTKSPDGRRTLEDLIQDGWIGALTAWDDYDPSKAKGGSFRTYASSMIRWAIWNGARTADRNQARVYVQKLRGRDRPEDHATVNPVSLDTLYGLDDKDHCMAIGIMDRPNETLANESFDRFLGYIRKPRVRYVLEQHYRFERTLVDIGRDLGVSRERVRQLLVQGQEVIRQKLDMEGREK